MRTIVVGFDGSDGSCLALKWAVAEGAVRSWRVTAVLAWGWLDQYHREGEPFVPDYDASAAERELERAVAEVLGEEAASIGRRAVCDLAPRALLEAVDGDDLLVVGARGHGGFLGLRLGSVSEKVLHRSRAPVAVIREGVDTGSSALPVVVGVDGSDGSAAALGWAIDEASARDVPLEVVHCWQTGLVGLDPYAYTADTVESLQQASAATLDGAAAVARDAGVVVVPRLVEGPAAATLVDASKTASLVVVGTRGRSTLEYALAGSVAKQVVHHAHAPVVAVPPAAARPGGPPGR